jgi:hypothetical protein
MMARGLGFFLTFIVSTSVLAQSELQFEASASTKGKLVYTEKHTVNFDNAQKPVRAKTEYLDPSLRVIATMETEFKNSISAPDHIFRNLRSGHVHGIRYNDKNTVLYYSDKGAAEKSKNFPREFDKDSLAVGGQGLFYYLRENYSEVQKRKKIPLKFLIPGRLDVYDFELELKSEKDGIAHIELHIKNWILRIFAPKLDVYYDINNKRLVSYQGLSNITDEKGQTQVVNITYKYVN